MISNLFGNKIETMSYFYKKNSYVIVFVKEIHAFHFAIFFNFAILGFDSFFLHIDTENKRKIYILLLRIHLQRGIS